MSVKKKTEGRGGRGSERGGKWREGWGKGTGGGITVCWGVKGERSSCNCPSGLGQRQSKSLPQFL